MPQITELWAFVSHEDDDPDDEGICAFLTADGWMPMVGADKARIEQLRPMAETLAGATRIELRRFSAAEVIEVIRPGGTEPAEENDYRRLEGL